MNQIDSKDVRTFEVCIKEYLKEQYHVSDEKLQKLYHPSMMEMYPRVQRTNNHWCLSAWFSSIDQCGVTLWLCVLCSDCVNW